MYGALRGGPPGRRFQEINRHHGRSGGRASRLVVSVAGLALGVAGLVTYPIPGPPSTLMVLCGAALLARSSHRGARALDRAELGLRRWGSASSRLIWWRRGSPH